MTRLVHQAIESGENPRVLIDLRRICGEEEGSTWVPKSPQEIANRIFWVRTPELVPSPPSLSTTAANVPLCLQTAYMGMEKNSSPRTRKRAADLAEVIGANHLDFECVSVFS
jgi:NAD+ synthase (glutamine-hydrolysing)